MSETSWYLEHLTDGTDHQLVFSIDLDPEYLEGGDPTVTNWLAVLIKTARYVHDTEVELEDELIEVD